MSARKITVGVPTGEYFTVCRDFFISFSKMLKYSYEHDVADEINLIFAASPMAAQNRNAILEGDSSHIFMVDADMTFPADTLEKMLAASEKQNNAVISGLAFMGAPPFYPSIYKWHEDKQVASPIGTWPAEPFEVDAVGSFGMLIPRHIAKVLGPNAFSHMFLQNFQTKESAEIRHDFAFCKRVRAAGFKIVCIPSIEFGHIRPYPITQSEWHQSLAMSEEFSKKNGEPAK